MQQYATKKDILERAQELIGIPFKNIDTKGILASGKGAIGNLIQECWFGIPVNSDPRPDFVEADVELKAHPFRYNRNGQVVAKERLVCDIINYMEEYNKTFETSAFYLKCHDMLLLPYEDKINISKEYFSIAKAVLFSFPEEDLAIIRDDWGKIISKIKSGIAEQISEGDTLYLGACTKGANSSSLRKQPFSYVLAKQRAYCLKTSYMTYILQNYIFGNIKNEKIVSDVSMLKDKTFEEYVVEKIDKYKNYSIDELCDCFKIDKKKPIKNKQSLLAFNILGLKSNKAEEFIKAGINVKTIRLNANNTITESMSFRTFKFKEIANQTWEDSDLQNYFSETRFLFIVYKQDGNGILRLKGCQFWNMPYNDLEIEMKKVWEITKKVILEGASFRKVDNKNTSDLPKLRDNKVGHVRPHARNSNDVDELPNGKMFPKQCFWLNNYYILSQLNSTFKDKE